MFREQQRAGLLPPFEALPPSLTRKVSNWFSASPPFGLREFSQQFRDQLRLAIHLDARFTHGSAGACLAASRNDVRRHALWVINDVETRALAKSTRG